MIIDLGRSSPCLQITPPGSSVMVPDVAEDKFQRDKTFGGIGIGPKLGTLRSGDLLVLAHDRSGLNGSTDASEYWPLWLVIRSGTSLTIPARYRICASRDDIPTSLGPQPVFTAETVELAEQP